MTGSAASPDLESSISPAEAERVLTELAAVFSTNLGKTRDEDENLWVGSPAPNLDAIYRVLVEQIPAVVFMAYLDRGMGEAYVSPRIEESLGFSQEEWLQDPVRWYNQIHPDDQQRWSIEAAEMFLSGKPLRSAYRVIARNGRVLWFQCEARMIRREDGRPWFIHGVGFDITDLKHSEQSLEDERNVVSATLDTVGALVVMLGPTGLVLRSNRASEHISGFPADAVRGQFFWDIFVVPEEAERAKQELLGLERGGAIGEFESDLITASGDRRRISWSSTLLPATGSAPANTIATGTDITERKRMERNILEVSAREQRQIGHDLHDGLGQHLTGIAFMAKVLQQQLADAGHPASTDAHRIVDLVNQAIHKTRELARGLLPVVSEAQGLMGALKQWSVEVEDLFQIPCRFDCPEPVLIADVSVATHLYQIAHEAVNNSIKHARPEQIVVSLTRREGRGVLAIEDDGLGLPVLSSDRTGLGLYIMEYRANMIGGSLELRPTPSGGTLVRCAFPLETESEGLP